MFITEHLFAREDPTHIPSEARDRADKAERKADGLILHLDFNLDPALDGSLFDIDAVSDTDTADVLLDVEKVRLPALCQETLDYSSTSLSGRSVTCPNCAKTCTFSNFAETIALRAESIDLEFYIERGWCQCLDPLKVRSAWHEVVCIAQALMH